VLAIHQNSQGPLTQIWLLDFLDDVFGFQGNFLSLGPVEREKVNLPLPAGRHRKAEKGQKDAFELLY